MFKLKKITIALTATAALLSAVGTAMSVAQEAPDVRSATYVFRWRAAVIPAEREWVCDRQRPNGSCLSGHWKWHVPNGNNGG